MSIRKHLIRLLDRPGGRGLLGWLASAYARSGADSPVDVYFDGVWMHRSSDYLFPTGSTFCYSRDSLRRLASQAQRNLADAGDFWFQHSRPQSGDVIVDVGAGRGEDTLAFSAAVGPAGRVIAVEAHLGSFKLLEQFCALNGLRNVTCLHVAVMDQPGEVVLEEAERWEEVAVGTGPAGEGMRVTAITLDELCRREGVAKVALLKVNIEGAESLALAGMEQTLSVVETICVACHDFRADRGDGERFRTRAGVESVLVSQGFRLVSRREDPRDYVRDHVYGLRE